MDIILDLAGALFVRSAIVAIMLNVTVAMNDALYFKTACRTLQADLSSTVEVVESDFRKIGYNVMLGDVFLAADTSYISFRADVDDSSNTDTITYYLSDTSALQTTPNPNDRLLYRRVNSLDVMVGSGVTRFYLRYYSASGVEETDRGLIVSLNVELRAEHGTFTSNEVYPEVQWQRRIFPINR